jgi:hypothetical protein
MMSRNKTIKSPCLLVSLSFCLLVCLCILAGCSDPKRATVKGTVLLDKKPLARAGVQFWPKSDIELDVYSGKTDDEGHFELKSRTLPFVKAGSYVVLIAKEVKVKDGKPPDETDDLMLLAKPVALKNILPAKYFDRAKPKFIVDVKPGLNELPAFELTQP